MPHLCLGTCVCLRAWVCGRAGMHASRCAQACAGMLVWHVKSHTHTHTHTRLHTHTHKHNDTLLHRAASLLLTIRWPSLRPASTVLPRWTSVQGTLSRLVVVLQMPRSKSSNRPLMQNHMPCFPTLLPDSGGPTGVQVCGQPAGSHPSAAPLPTAPARSPLAGLRNGASLCHPRGHEGGAATTARSARLPPVERGAFSRDRAPGCSLEAREHETRRYGDLKSLTSTPLWILAAANPEDGVSFGRSSLRACGRPHALLHDGGLRLLVGVCWVPVATPNRSGDAGSDKTSVMCNTPRT